jgi:hypothetical protein
VLIRLVYVFMVRVSGWFMVRVSGWPVLLARGDGAAAPGTVAVRAGWGDLRYVVCDTAVSVSIEQGAAPDRHPRNGHAAADGGW